MLSDEQGSRIVEPGLFTRVAIVGTVGSGKTSLAKWLAGKVDAPHVELDAMLWECGWAKVDRRIFEARVDEATSRPSWIIDSVHGGNVLRWLCERAQLLVWLDLPLSTCWVRTARRTISRAARRTTLWNGNHETWRSALLSRDSQLLWCLRDYHPRRAKLELAVRAWRSRGETVILPSATAVRAWQSDVAKQLG